MDIQAEASAKVEKLSRDILRTRCVSAVLFVCLIFANAATWLRRPATVDANEFLLKDKAGNVVARLGQNGQEESCLTFSGKQSTAVASLCMQKGGGSYLDLHDVGTESRAILTPGLELFEPSGHVQPSLVISRGESNKFVSINVGAETKLVIGRVTIESPEGEPKITLFGPDQKAIWSAPH